MAVVHQTPEDELEMKSALSASDTEGPSVATFEDPSGKSRQRKGCLSITLATNLSFFVNILLFIAKLTAALTSGSIAVVASTVDSFLDLLSGSIVWLTNRSINKTDVAEYPAGRSRLEPVGIIVFATMMGMATLQLLSESIQELFGAPKVLNITATTIAILCSTILFKFALFVLCAIILRTTPSSSVEALKDDHRNDCLSNAVSVIAAVVASQQQHLWYMDPVGAIVISIYILAVWVRTGWEQVQMLSGRVASKEFKDEVTELCNTHYPGMFLDKLRAYHFGARYLVEVEVVLPGDMLVRVAHDIGLALQHKIEALDDVARAFVHVDYEVRDHEEHREERELLQEQQDKLARKETKKQKKGARRRASTTAAADGEDEAAGGQGAGGAAV